MSHSPELYWIDCLTEDEMALVEVPQYFRDQDHFRDVLLLYVHADAVSAHRGSCPMSKQELVELICSNPTEAHAGVMLFLTDEARAHLFSGKWDELFKRSSSRRH